MSKLYRVVFNDEQLDSYNISIGDICTLVKDDGDGTAWFKNTNWKDDGLHCLAWSEVEEVLEEPEMNVKMIEITEEEFERLQERDDFLSALECAGVDNWEGIDQAHEYLREWREDLDLEETN